MPFNKLSILAFRDLGRNRRRTIFSLVAVALGLALMLTMDGFISGVWDDALENSIRLHTGHVQLRAESYEPEKLSLQWEDLLENSGELADAANAMPEVEMAVPVLRASAIINTVDDSDGVQLTGIDTTSPLHDVIREGIVDGAYLQPDDRSGILVGVKLAEELGLQVGRDVSLSVINSSGQPVDAIFTIRGIFDTDVDTFDDRSVFMPIARAQALTGVGDRASVVTVLLNNENDQAAVAATLQSPGVRALTADEMNEVLMQTFNVGMGFYNIMYAIVMMIVAVVIANTLLMSVFERVRELGILASLGMKGRQIMTMILVEAVILSFLGVVVGCLLGAGFVYYLANVGFDAGTMASTVDDIAMSSTMYGRFVPLSFVTLSAWTIGVVLLASLYPAWYAAKLEPVEALHSL